MIHLVVQKPDLGTMKDHLGFDLNMKQMEHTAEIIMVGSGLLIVIDTSCIDYLHTYTTQFNYLRRCCHEEL